MRGIVIAALIIALTALSSSANAIATPYWTSPFVIGDLIAGGGMAIAWETPLPGPVVNIGHINYFVIEPLPCTSSISIIPHPWTDNLVILDEFGMEHQAQGWGIGVNCDYFDGWECHCNTSMQESTWGKIKTLY